MPAPSAEIFIFIEITLIKFNKSLFYIAFTALCLAGCTVPQYNYTPEVVEKAGPALNESMQAEVGDTLLETAFLVEFEALVFPEETSIGPVTNFRFTKGHLVKRGDDDTSEFFGKSNLPGASKISMNPLSNYFSAIQLMKDDSKLCAVTVNGGRFCRDDVTYERARVAAAAENTFWQRLLLTGIDEDKLELEYQSWTGIAGQAPDARIGFTVPREKCECVDLRGARIEFSEIRESSATYRVTRNFSKPVLGESGQ